jgi:hypothetical protein
VRGVDDCGAGDLCEAELWAFEVWGEVRGCEGEEGAVSLLSGCVGTEWERLVGMM